MLSLVTPAGAQADPPGDIGREDLVAHGAGAAVTARRMRAARSGR